MAKKNKKTKADAVYAKKAIRENPFATAKPATSKKLNPFEVHVNKEKFQILGRTCKHDKGLPGVSRAKALKKRTETLGKQYANKNKSNYFQDRRIGKHLSGDQLTERVMNARFMAEKLSQIKQDKASRFDLNDDEVLTHRGQTLEEIQQFRDERSDDDDDADDEGLNAEFTEAAHFGGEANEDKDRKTAIDEMIVEQKRRKLEIAKEKNEIFKLTEELDTNYKDLVGLMGKTTKSDFKEKPDPDDYDKLMREMIFEPRSTVTDKLLSAEEQAKQEKERLETLENARLKRMRAEEEGDDAQKMPNHRSADDLDDGYFAYGEEEEEGTLAYHLDGKLGTNTDTNGEDVQNGDNDDSEDAGDDEEEEEGTDSEENSDDDNNDDNLSDLKVTESENESENGSSTDIKAKGKTEASKQKIKLTEISNEIPFTIDMPNTYAEFNSLLTKHTPENQAIIVDRLIKCNHPKLDGVNREKVVKLFAFLLQYINELFADATQDDVAYHFKILDRLNPYLYDLVQLNPERMSTTLATVIKEKYGEYRKNPKQFPSLETVVFFKLISNYYSTSDFRHPIVTPTYVFIQHVLSKARARCRQDIAIGLFIVTIALEFAQQSKRFLPAVFNFLLGIIFISIPKRSIETLKIVPPFESTGPFSKLLAIPADSVEFKHFKDGLMQSVDLVTTTIIPEFKIRAFNTTLRLIKDAVESVSDNIGCNYLAEPFLNLFERLSLTAYPEAVQRNFVVTENALTALANKRLTKLVPPAKMPKALRLLEPRFETVYDDKRRPKLSKEKEERAKLLHKIKRETKGAIREIRRDTEFLQQLRIRQQIQSDNVRKEKVKRIYQEASMQQGELNELARAKKKKKI